MSTSQSSAIAWGAAPVAVVTGGSGGIGRALTMKLAERGWRLVLVERCVEKAARLKAEIEARHPGAVAGQDFADLSDVDAVHALAGRIATQAPRLDGLFNNAGVLTAASEISPQGHELHLAVNVLAPVILITRLAQLLRGSPENGTVVNTGSGASNLVRRLEPERLSGPQKPFVRLFGSYARSKQALNMVSAALARRFAASGPRIVTVEPGPTRTPMTRGRGMPLVLKPFVGLAFGTPEAAAGRLIRAGLDAHSVASSGSFIVNGRATTLPSRINQPAAQDAILDLCLRLSHSETPAEGHRT